MDTPMTLPPTTGPGAFLDSDAAADGLALAIRGHQAIEELLNAAISEALPEPHVLELEQLSMALKIDLAVALRVLRADSRATFLALTRLRGRFAHRADAAVDQGDASALREALSEWQRHLIGRELQGPVDPTQVLRQVVAVALAEAKGALLRLREQRLVDAMLPDLFRDVVRELPARWRASEGFRLVDNELRERLANKRIAS